MRTGIHIAARATTSRISELDSHSVTERAGAEIEEFWGSAAARLLQYQQRHAAPDKAGGQRDDDVGHPGNNDHQPVDGADRRARDQNHDREK